MKLRSLNVSLYWFLPLAVIFILGAIFGSFFDLEISNALVNQSSVFGRIVESFGMLPAYFLMVTAGVLLFKSLYKRENKWLAALGYILLIAVCTICVYFVHTGFDEAEVNQNFGYSFNIWLSYGLAILITAMFCVLNLLIIKKTDNPRLMIAIAIIISFTFLFQVGAINLIKGLARRPRYRNELGNDFVPWYIFNSSNPKHDLYKSFPSGHTATGVVFMLLPLLSNFNEKLSVKILFPISHIYCLLVPFFRIYYGAHYLSDVSFGGFICLFGIVFSLVVANIIINAIHTKTPAQQN